MNGARVVLLLPLSLRATWAAGLIRLRGHLPSVASRDLQQRYRGGGTQLEWFRDYGLLGERAEGYSPAEGYSCIIYFNTLLIPSCREALSPPVVFRQYWYILKSGTLSSFNRNLPEGEEMKTRPKRLNATSKSSTKIARFWRPKIINGARMLKGLFLTRLTNMPRSSRITHKPAQHTVLDLSSARVSLLLCRTGAAPEATTWQCSSGTSWKVGCEVQFNVGCTSQMTVVHTRAQMWWGHVMHSSGWSTICQITANNCQFCHQTASFALFKRVVGALEEDNNSSNNHLPVNVVAPSLLETDHYWRYVANVQHSHFQSKHLWKH